MKSINCGASRLPDAAASENLTDAAPVDHVTEWLTADRLDLCLKIGVSVAVDTDQLRRRRVRILRKRRRKSLENLSSRIDMHTHAGSTLRNTVTLTFDLLTSESMSRTRLRVYVYKVWRW